MFPLISLFIVTTPRISVSNTDYVHSTYVLFPVVERNKKYEV